MGSPGLDFAGYLQVSNATPAKLITCTMGNTTCTGSCGWYNFEVISTEIQLASVTAPALAGSSLITSGTTFVRGAVFSCGKITAINISAKSSNGKVIAHERTVRG